MVGGNGKRRAHDFYPTPDAHAVVSGLHRAAPWPPASMIWEPAAGTGEIVAALGQIAVGSSDETGDGCSIIATDLYQPRKWFQTHDERGAMRLIWYRWGVDYTLLTPESVDREVFPARPIGRPAAVITNPPFSLAQQFLETTMLLNIPYCALLLKAN